MAEVQDEATSSLSSHSALSKWAPLYMEEVPCLKIPHSHAPEPGPLNIKWRGGHPYGHHVADWLFKHSNWPQGRHPFSLRAVLCPAVAAQIICSSRVQNALRSLCASPGTSAFSQHLLRIRAERIWHGLTGQSETCRSKGRQRIEKIQKNSKFQLMGSPIADHWSKESTRCRKVQHARRKFS